MSKIKTSLIGLSLGALGIVFGDIGTSPLYALNVLFGQDGRHLSINRLNIYGVISLIIWSITLVVSIKFLAFIMRADNEGEGGIMALMAHIKSSKLKPKYRMLFIFLGIIGVGLFYGDSTITPAISVLSAVEGLKVVAPKLSALILPVTLIILALLFMIQKYGTGLIGKLFGPVMLIWFTTLAIGGGWQVWLHPQILIALSPLTTINFFISQPVIAFFATGAVVLAITGAEALYADMGHFGRPPIAKAWFFVVFPSLMLCYMGEGALMLQHPSASANPLVLLFPSLARLPIVLLATLATIIASQSVISGAFSLTRQAVQLDFLPKMLIRHTSTIEGGQIYLPFVNIVLFIVVSMLVIVFGSSIRLANAYGVAVSGTLATDTILYLVILRSVWQKPIRTIVLMGLVFVPIDLLFVTSSAPKILKGGWFPVLIGIFIFILISTWLKGQKIMIKERRALEEPLLVFIAKVHDHLPPISRIPGTAIYIGHHHDLTPLALNATFEELHELPEKVIIVTVEVTPTSHIAEHKRIILDDLGQSDDGIGHVSLFYGYHDTINIPEVLRQVKRYNNQPDYDLDLDNAAYFISQGRVVFSNRHNLSLWRKHLYSFMARNALSTSDFYKLPISRTEEMQPFIKL